MILQSQLIMIVIVARDKIRCYLLNCGWCNAITATSRINARV